MLMILPTGDCGCDSGGGHLVGGSVMRRRSVSDASDSMVRRHVCGLVQPDDLFKGGNARVDDIKWCETSRTRQRYEMARARDSFGSGRRCYCGDGSGHVVRAVVVGVVAEVAMVATVAVVGIVLLVMAASVVVGRSS
jgi:hypothetical protein